jgi:hypothetical protein
MNYVSSVAERAILSVDRFINQAMTYAWTSTLEHRCPGRELMPPPWKAQPDGEENGGGDRRSSETHPTRPVAKD